MVKESVYGETKSIKLPHHRLDDTVSCDCHVEEHQENTGKTKLLIILGIALTIPIVVLESLYDSKIIDFYQLVLATPIQVLLGWQFYSRFIEKIKYKILFSTDTLVVISTSVAYGYGLLSVLTGSHAPFFEASASVLTIFTVGEYLENRVRKKTSESMKELVELKPKTAIIIRNDTEQIVDANDIVVDDVVLVKPGQKIPADGIIVYGESIVDESMISGESIPSHKQIGYKVIAGTINKTGYFRFRATHVGSHTVLAGIIQIVEKAQSSKAHIQRIADRAVRYFIPVLFSVAIISAVTWSVLGASLEFVVTVFATILVVACPCALGIATPMVVSLGIDKAARKGVLIKGGEFLEKLAHSDIIVFDKTGTLTVGEPSVTDIITNKAIDQNYLLQITASIEKKSEHPIAHAIVEHASKSGVNLVEMQDFSSITGQGVVATYLQKIIFVGKPSYYAEKIPQNFQSKISNLESEGKTVVVVFVDDYFAGIIAVADTIRDDAKQVVSELKKMKKQVILMSGDNHKTAIAIAKKIGIENIMADMIPAAKSEQIIALQKKGKRVIMIGDGINDAPALAQADVGIAIGSGTDIAMESGNVILIKNNLKDIIFALKISKYSLGKIKQNLVMSFAYNAIAISIAAGLFYSITHSLILSPSLAAFGWIISDTSVFGNSLLVRKFTVR